MFNNLKPALIPIKTRLLPVNPQSVGIQVTRPIRVAKSSIESVEQSKLFFFFFLTRDKPKARELLSSLPHHESSTNRFTGKIGGNVLRWGPLTSFKCFSHIHDKTTRGNICQFCFLFLVVLSILSIFIPSDYSILFPRVGKEK